MAVKHAFTSTKADAADDTLVRASDWNEDHEGTNPHLHDDVDEGGNLRGVEGGWAPLSSGILVPSSFLGSGTADDTTFLRGDGVWGVPPGTAAGMAQGYVGKNAIGASFIAFGNRQVLLKRITLAEDRLLASVGAHVKRNSVGAVSGMRCAVYTDVASAPGLVIAYNNGGETAHLYMNSGSARWLDMPMGIWLPAASYWLAVMEASTSDLMQIAYDTGGSDRAYTAGGGWITDAGTYPDSDTTRDYSIRGNTIR